MFYLLFLLVSTDVQIDNYIKDMGHKKWREREHATWKLKFLGERAYPAVIKACKDSDPEIAQRAETVIQTFYQNILPTTYGKLPWIDGLPNEYPMRCEIIEKYMLNKSRDWDKDMEYIGYRQATAEFVEHLHKSGKPRKEIVDLLDKMVEGEKKQLETMRQSSNYKPECDENKPLQ